MSSQISSGEKSYRGGIKFEVWGKALTSDADCLAGIIRRLIAFIVDLATLVASCFILGMLLFDFLVFISPWSRVFGFFAGMIYFGLMDSKLTGGMTLGKRLLKIKTTTKDGESISIQRAMGRYTVLFLPALVFSLPHTATSLVYTYPLLALNFMELIMLGFSLSLFYLIIFNRATRQSLHDIVTKTLVTDVTYQGGAKFSQGWAGHKVFVMIFMIGSFLLPFYTRTITTVKNFDEFVELQQSINDLPGVGFTGLLIVSQQGEVFGERFDYKLLNFTLYVNEEISSYGNLADRVAYLIIRDYSGIHDTRIVRVNIVYGYNLIFANWNVEKTFRFSPDQWRQRFRSRTPVDDPYLAEE